RCRCIGGVRAQHQARQASHCPHCSLCCGTCPRFAAHARRTGTACQIRGRPTQSHAQPPEECAGPAKSEIGAQVRLSSARGRNPPHDRYHDGSAMMRCRARDTVLTLAAMVALGQSAPAMAQAKPPSAAIEIEYVEPARAYLRPIYERLKNRKVLEQLKDFLSPLILPVTLHI